MNYTFECSECGHKEMISMPIKEYTCKGHYCHTCNSEMKRTVESLVCGYKNCQGFFGKSGQHD